MIFINITTPQQLTIPSGYGFSHCPLNGFPGPRSPLSCHRKMAASCFACVRSTYLLCKWKSERSGPSAGPSLVTCLCMTLTWCLGLSPECPRSFPILEKYSAERNSFSQMVTPQSRFAPCILPARVLTWQQFNSLSTIFFHVCYQIPSYTKLLFFQGLIRLKVQILQDNGRTEQI